MRRLRQFFALAILLAVPMAAVAADETGKSRQATITVADFAVMLAASAGQSRALEAEGVARALLKAGVPLGDPKAALSERKLSEILGHYGAPVKPSWSERPVTRGKAEAALLLMGPSSIGGAGRPNSALATPRLETVDDCVALSKNHGQCVVCCKDLGIAANSCTRFCVSFTGKPSPSEPLP